MKKLLFVIIMSGLIVTSQSFTANAGWKNVVNGLINKNVNIGLKTQTTQQKPKITYKEKTSALKQALEMGVKYAISNLSKTNGFLNNPYVKIPIPNSLKTVAKALKSVGQERIVNNFVAEMNHAAEKAAPKTVNIFIRAIKHMSIKDATKILTGPDDAATQYFKKHTYKSLFRAIKPIVKQSTSKTNVTKYYKAMMNTYKKYEKPLNTLSSYKNMLTGKKPQNNEATASDLDTYITQKAIKGIFFMIAKEEKRIRQNPVARTTSLLKKVFGYFQK